MSTWIAKHGISTSHGEIGNATWIAKHGISTSHGEIGNVYMDCQTWDFYFPWRNRKCLHGLPNMGFLLPMEK